MLLMCIAFPYFLLAQETEKQKEIGLAFNSLNSFGLTYRTGTAKSLWRFNTLYISGIKSNLSSDLSEDIESSWGFGIKFGKEFRKVVAKNLEIRYGADLAFSFSKIVSETNDKTESIYDMKDDITYYRPGVSLVFGLNYVFNDKLVIGAEILPSFNYSFGFTKTKDYNSEITKGKISGFNFGLSNNSALLSLAYRF